MERMKDEVSSAGIQEVGEMIIRKRKLFLIPFFLVLAATLVVGLFLPKTYESSSLIQVKSKKIIDPLVNGLAVPPDIRDELETLTRQVLVWPRLEQLVTQLHLADRVRTGAEREEFIKELRDRVSVRVRNKEIIEIVYQDHDPVVCQQVVNTLTQNFLEENGRRTKEEARLAIDFIWDQLKIYRKKLETSQMNFTTSKIDADLRLALNRRHLLEERMATIQKIVPSQVTTEQNPVVAQLQTRVALLEMEQAKLALDATEYHPRLQELKSEIATLRGKIGTELDKQNVKQSISTFNPMYLQAEQELKVVDMEINYLQERKKELENSGLAPVRHVTEEEIANLERDKKVDEDIYQMLLRQLEAAYVSERLQDSETGGRFAVIEYGRLPISPVKPNMMKVGVVGVFGGVMLGLGFVLLSENIARSFQTADQAKEFLRLMPLGSISRMIPEKESTSLIRMELQMRFNKYFQNNALFSKMRFVTPHIARRILNSNILPQVVMYHEPQCKIAEEVRVVRINIEQGVNLDAPLKTIAVSSALRGEGKSTTSANLSIAFADSGKRTLLVDCDLRKGTLHDLFAQPKQPGLVEVLQGNASLEGTVVKSPVKNLSILPGGARPSRPAELLGSARMEELIKYFTSAYDVILLDCPPVLTLPDACVVSKYSDGIVSVVQAGRTKREDVAAALSTLRQVNARLVGFILTNVQYHMPRYMYDYYYEN